MSREEYLIVREVVEIFESGKDRKVVSTEIAEIFNKNAEYIFKTFENVLNMYEIKKDNTLIISYNKKFTFTI